MAGHSLVYSARDKAVLMIAGDDAGPIPIYKLSSGKWKKVPGSDLSARSLAAVAADDEGNVLVHGGAVGVRRDASNIDFKPTADTWLWNGKEWKKVASSGPAARDHHAMVYDSARKRFVLFGGSDADPTGRSTFFGDTWEWDGATWKQVANGYPSARCHHAMAYDPVRKQTILVGGYGPSGGDRQTWAWNGGTWTAVAQGSPAERGSPRLAWDSNRSAIMLFGGDVGNTTPSDTWQWDGKAWSKVVGTGPRGRTVHGMAFDRTRGSAIIFGGASGNDVLGDTWEFTQGKWTQIGL